jgi:hypothetical protein
MAAVVTARAQDAEETPSYGARAKVTEAHAVSDQFTGTETRALEHSMGPAFSFAESLPGVVPVFSGVPYLIVRGATPSGTLSYYDGILLPSLFHLALGPSITEPLLSGETQFYAGAAPARYGPHLGGVLDRSPPEAAMLQQPIRRLELSALDASGMLQVPLDDGSLSVSWRYGNPGLMLRALGLDATLGYYDYQVRYQTLLSESTQLTLVLLGAGDHLGERTAPAEDIDLSFHRLMGRLVRHWHAFELGAQLVLGYDASTLGQQLSGHALRATPQLYAQWHSGHTQLRAGTELAPALVKLARGSAAAAGFSTSGFVRSSTLSLDPEDFLDGQPYSKTPNRNLWGTYVELHLEPLPHLRTDLQLRLDAFIASSQLQTALDPAVVVRYRARPWLDLHAAAALVHMPRTSPLSIPGLDDVSLDVGIMSAIQSEAGATIQLGSIASLEATAFYHRYLDVVYLELILDCQGNTNPAAAQGVLMRDPDALASICRRSGLPTADGEAYGMELFLRRDLTERLSGFVSYTWSYAHAVARDGTSFTPQADVRHLLNAVLQYDLGAGFKLGLRMHFRTGKMAVNTIFNSSLLSFTRLEQRLPAFFRLDLRASYGWTVSFGRLEAFVGMQNATFSREATNRDCFPAQDNSEGVVCSVDYQPFIVLPNAGLRADF